MAINVNTVYQTVLLILNKEQRGYMTPVEFNKIGAQVQLEIFETYFDSLNQQIRIPQTNTDYADRVVNLDEKISIFKTSGSALYTNSVFNLPVSSGAATLTDTITVPTVVSPALAPTTYTISLDASLLADSTPTVAVNGTLRAGNTFNIVGNILTFLGGTQPLQSFTGVQIAASTNSKSIVIAAASGTAGSSLMINAAVSGAQTLGAPTVTSKSNAPGPYNTGLSLAQTYTGGAAAANLLTFTNTIVVQSTPKDFYRLGSVRYEAGGNVNIQELERVTRSELYHLLSSNLTKPTTTYPVYLYEKEQLTVYPTTIQSGIEVDYVRKPVNPVWNFKSEAPSFQYIYNAETSVNFEIHPADQTELILKTLLYAGVVIEDPQIVQVAAQQIQQENINQQR